MLRSANLPKSVLNRRFFLVVGFVFFLPLVILEHQFDELKGAIDISIVTSFILFIIIDALELILHLLVFRPHRLGLGLVIIIFLEWDGHFSLRFVDATSVEEWQLHQQSQHSIISLIIYRDKSNVHYISN